MPRGSPRARRVFLSYRRQGGQAFALSLYQDLAEVLGRKQVFLDVAERAIEAGHPWRDSVREAIGRCDTLLLVYDPDGADRLSAEDDPIRFELEAAAARGARVVVVRVDGAEMPRASELPEALAWLPELHSPEIHTDSAVADLKRLIEELTGREPGAVRWVDRRDLLVLGGIAGVGLLAWISWGRRLFNLQETWQSGGALLLVWLGWLALRRALPSPGRGWIRQDLARAARWGLVVVALGGGWLLWWRAGHRVPTFAAGSGILVARFSGDPSDRTQDSFAKVLRSEAAAVADGGERVVAALPRRVDAESARRLGKRSGAAAVLWGALLNPEGSSPRLDARLSFIERRAVFEPLGDITGVVEPTELRLGGDLEALKRALPRLLEGYRRYHTAADEEGYRRASVYFSDALDQFADSRDRSVTSAALAEIEASLDFYLGNTQLLLGHREQAVAAYREAIDHSLHAVEGAARPQYIEAVNNLGWSLLTGGDPEAAVSELERVDPECDDRPELRSCAYAWYNVGIAHLKNNELMTAQARLEQARDRIAAAGEDSDDLRLAGFCHQNIAYVLVRRAAAAAGADKEGLLDRASEQWSRGIASFGRAGLEPPAAFEITPARIHLEKGEWREGIDVLSSIDGELTVENRADLHALLAAAWACEGDTARSQQHLEQVVAPSVGFASVAVVRDAISEFQRISDRCR